MASSRKPPRYGIEVIEREYRGELDGYERAARLVASDKRKNVTGCYAHMADSALWVALGCYFLGKDEEIVPWLRKSSEAGIGLFATAGTPYVEVTTLDENGRIVSVERRRDASMANLGEYKALAEAGLMVNDGDILTRIGDIQPRAFMDPMSMSPDPERYEEGTLLRVLCRGEEDDAREMLASWDGRVTVAELRSLGVGDDPEMPALNPWRGFKPPRVRCIEAILLGDGEALHDALGALLAQHKEERDLIVGLACEEICVPAVCVSVLARRRGLLVTVRDKYLPEELVEIIVRETSDPGRRSQ